MNECNHVYKKTITGYDLLTCPIVESLCIHCKKIKPLNMNDEQSIQRAKDNLEINKNDPYLQWQSDQPDKIKAMLYHHNRYQLAEMTDREFADKVIQIIFKDKPIKRVTITGTPPKPGSNI